MIDPIIFVFFIVGLGVTAVVLVLRCLQRTRAERPHLQRLEQALVANPVGLPSVDDLKLGSLARMRLEDVTRLQDAEATVDAVALADYTTAIVERGLQVPRAIASILVLLGLCGAIFGLFKVVNGMAGPLQELQKTFGGDTTSEAMKAGLQSLFSQMGTSMSDTRNAFMCSLSGIGGTVVLLIVIVFVSNEIDITLQLLEGITLRHLLPRLSAGSQALHVRQVGEIFKQGTVTLAEALDRLQLQSTQVHEHIGDLHAFVHRLKQGTLQLDQVHERVGKSQEALLGMAREFVGMAERIEKAETTSSAELQKMVQALGVSEELTHQAVSESRQLREQLTANLQRLEEGQTAGRDQTETLVTSIAATLNLLSGVLEAGQAASQQSTLALGGVNDRLSVLAQQLQKEREEQTAHFDSLLEHMRVEKLTQQQAGETQRGDIGRLLIEFQKGEQRHGELQTGAEQQQRSLQRLTDVLQSLTDGLGSREVAAPDWQRLEKIVASAAPNWEPVQSHLNQTGVLLREFVAGQKSNGHTRVEAIAPAVVSNTEDKLQEVIARFDTTMQRQERASRTILSGVIACSIAVPAVVFGEMAMVAHTFPLPVAACVGGGVALASIALAWLGFRARS